MTYRPEPADMRPASPPPEPWYRMMLELQHAQLLQLNVMRAMLHLPPVRAPKSKNRDGEQEGGSDERA